MTRKIIKRLLFYGSLFFLLTTSIISGYLLGEYYYFQERFPKDHYLGPINLSELTLREATDYLTKISARTLLPEPVYLKFEDKRFKVLLPEIGILPQIEASVKKSYLKSRQSIDLKESLKSKATGIISHHPFLLKVADEDKTLNFLKSITPEVAHSSQNAYFTIEAEGVVIIPEVEEIKLDLQESLKEIKSAINNQATEISLRVTRTPPQITKNLLAKIDHPTLLGSYTTYYGNHDSPNRIYNIHFLAKRINETLVPKGKVFSLLSKTGDFTAKEGYKEALVIFRNELVPQYGGGACQIATTLYNSVLKADLEIVRRRNHNIYFSIYPLGRDATIYYPMLDFKFKNNTDNFILIYAKADKRKLNFKIFGEETGKKVYLIRPKIEYSTMEAILSASAETSEEVKTLPFKTIVTKIVKKDDKVIERKEIKSYYRAHGDLDRAKIKIRKKKKEED